MKKIILVAITSIAMVLQSCSKDVTTPSSNTPSTTKVSSTSVQCSATAVSTGKRCLNMTKSPNGKCYLHGGN
jgi:hypothetical protein